MLFLSENIIYIISTKLFGQQLASWKTID